MSIDACYDSAIAKLKAENQILQISQKLLSFTQNDQRVIYVYEILESLKIIPPVLEVTKSADVSTCYRNLGNEVYQKNGLANHYMALQYYNLSLLHAPVGSDEYSLSLANRSAVFFSMKKYNECIKDIDQVFSTKFPEKLKEKLINRKNMCKESETNMKKIEESGPDTEIEILCTLQDKRDLRYLCASTKLEVVYSKEMGRHVIAKEDIKVGELLVQEDPYFVLLLKPQYLFSCSYCLSRNLNLLPCPNCCFALYCSEKCKKNAWTEYHATECSLMATLLHMDFTKLEWLGLRTVIKARNDHLDWESLFKTIEEVEENLDTEYRGHVKVNNQWVFDSKHYASIHTLASNIEKRGVSDIFQKCVTAAVFLRFLIEKTTFLDADSDAMKNKIKQYVAGLLLHHIMTSPTNMHGIAATVQTADGNYVEELSVASAPYAYHSLINHSCAPNVVRLNRLGTGQMMLFALRPIKKGMQLFDNYGCHHALEDYTNRHRTLESQYKFTCLCEACINRWPMYYSMKPATKLSSQVTAHIDKLVNQSNIEKLQKGDIVTAKRLFKPLCELAEWLEPYAPCKDLADCQETLKQCLQIFGGLVPYGCSKIVPWNAKPPKL